MYITNNPLIANIAEQAGIDWIFVDMEWIGKDKRQGGLDTVKNHHTFDDVRIIKESVTKAKVLVRINPIHESLYNYPSTEEEIERSISAGADILMLPYFKTIEEVQKFISCVNRRVKTCLLMETPEAASILDKIVEVNGIDMIHIGLNDMHLAMNMKFMFQVLTEGYVEKWANIIKSKGIKFGFGGLASLNGGVVPGNLILKEHYRLGSSMVIVSRSFCNTDIITNPCDIKKIFETGITAIRSLENEIKSYSEEHLMENKQEVIDKVSKIVHSL